MLHPVICIVHTYTCTYVDLFTLDILNLTYNRQLIASKLCYNVILSRQVASVSLHSHCTLTAHSTLLHHPALRIVRWFDNVHFFISKLSVGPPAGLLGTFFLLVFLFSSRFSFFSSFFFFLVFLFSFLVFFFLLYYFFVTLPTTSLRTTLLFGMLYGG